MPHWPARNRSSSSDSDIHLIVYFSAGIRGIAVYKTQIEQVIFHSSTPMQQRQCSFSWTDTGHAKGRSSANDEPWRSWEIAFACKKEKKHKLVGSDHAFGVYLVVIGVMDMQTTADGLD